MTAKECGDALGKQLNAVSGRVTELLELDKIEDTGERRNRSRCVRWKP